MRRKVTLLVIVFVSVMFAQAHEFWLEPTKFIYKSGDMMSLHFMVGENFTGENWDIKPGRIAKLEHHAGTTVQDLTASVNPQEKKLQVQLNGAGTHLFALRSNNSTIELEADKFNEYLKSDGLDDILRLRENNNTLNKPAKENYARCAKLLVQVGENRDDTFKKIVGLPLEIVPLSNPYDLELTDQVRFQLWFQGKPLSFALVKIWNRGNGRTFIQNVYTEKDGTFTTRLSNGGVWMISSVKMIESRQPDADYQSFWASLVFGFN